MAWNSSGWHWQYRGAPQALAHVFGALHYELNGGLVRSERYYAALEIPLPIIAFVLILGAQLWRSGFRFRLSRLLTVVTLLCLLLVYYLYLQPPAALP